MNLKRKIIIFSLISSLLVFVTAPVAIACSWCIEKSANVTELVLATGQQYLVTYTINLTQTGLCDPDYPSSASIFDANFQSWEMKTCSGLPAGFFDWIVCVPGNETVTHNREYTVNVGPYYQCGDYTVVNTACLPDWPSDCDSSSWTITIHVPCEGGCTLTPGYWKTHSKYGPAPYDDTWAQIGEDAPFYSSGKSLYEALWKNPKGGNAYWILAHAFIAAELNILNGASSTPQIDAALAWANTFFSTYLPSSTLSKSQKRMVINEASLLDDYNNGYIGPGHCSE